MRNSGAGIRRILREQGRDQRWLALKIGYHETYVSKVLRGIHPASSEFVERCGAILGVPVADFGREEVPAM